MNILYQYLNLQDLIQYSNERRPCLLCIDQEHDLWTPVFVNIFGLFSQSTITIYQTAVLNHGVIHETESTVSAIEIETNKVHIFTLKGIQNQFRSEDVILRLSI